MPARHRACRRPGYRGPARMTPARWRHRRATFAGTLRASAISLSCDNLDDSDGYVLAVARASLSDAEALALTE